MKILFLPAYFFPESGGSPYLFDDRNQAFADSDIEMLAYVPYPSRGLTLLERKLFRSKRNESLYNGKMKLKRFPMFNEGHNIILRAIRYFLSSFIQFIKGIKAENIDVIYLESTPPFQGVVGSLLKKIKRKPFIYNLQDIFPDSMISAGFCKKGSLLWKIGRIIENFSYRNADKIIVISNGFKQNLIKKGVSEDKIEVVYNWVDEKKVISVERSENILFKRYNLDSGKFYITYCGNIGLSQNLDLLLKVAEDLSYNKDIHFVIIGEGAFKDELIRKIQQLNLSNITILPFQKYEEISHVFSLGNISLVISKEGVGENSVPSKTWSIMSASRPVLMNFDENELKDILLENKCGIFTKAGDKIAFEKAILYFYNNPEKCKKYGNNGRKYVMEHLTKKEGTKRIVDIVKHINEPGIN